MKIEINLANPDRIELRADRYLDKTHIGYKVIIHSRMFADGSYIFHRTENYAEALNAFQYCLSELEGGSEEK